MERFRLPHILLCGLISPFLITSLAAGQDRDAVERALPTLYQKRLDGDARYLISDEERAEFQVRRYVGLRTM